MTKCVGYLFKNILKTIFFFKRIGIHPPYDYCNTTGYPTPPSITAIGIKSLTSFTIIFGHPLISEICIKSYNIKIDQDGYEILNTSISRSQLHQDTLIDLYELIGVPVITCRYKCTFQITTDYGAVLSKKVIGNPNFKGAFS